MWKNHQRIDSKGGGGGGGCGGGDIDSGSYSPFDSLPEECISNIISFTSPRDACVLASVSKTFKSAIDSDASWEKFIPKNYASLVRRNRVFSSKKELYFALCNDPFLIHDGQKSFWLEKASGKKCMMLSAMNLSVTWGDTPQYWQWIRSYSFEKVAKLVHVCWFEIRGKINTRVLSPRTCYSAYIVFKKVEPCDGFKDVGIEARVGVVGQVASRRLICFDTATEMPLLRRRRRKQMGCFVKPEAREDWWMELELGIFFNGGQGSKSDEIEMSVSETKLLDWKRGLIILGIEIRPTNSW